jgi:hypothetical protein
MEFVFFVLEVMDMNTKLRKILKDKRYLALNGGECSASHPRPLYPQGKSPVQYQLGSRLGGPQSQSGCYREKKTLSPSGN